MGSLVSCITGLLNWLGGSEGRVPDSNYGFESHLRLSQCFSDPYDLNFVLTAVVDIFCPDCSRVLNLASRPRRMWYGNRTSHQQTLNV